MKNWERRRIRRRRIYQSQALCFIAYRGYINKTKNWGARWIAKQGTAVPGQCHWRIRSLRLQRPQQYRICKILFLYKGVGDSVYGILQAIHANAKEIASSTGKTEGSRQCAAFSHDPTPSGEWKEQDFSSGGPLPASMICILLNVNYFRLEQMFARAQP